MAGSAERHFFAARLRVRTVDLSMNRLGHRCSGFGASVTNGRSVMNSSISTVLVPINQCFADSERLALAGFVAGHRGSTREAYGAEPATVRCLVREP
jgi:hypothetical protein